MQFRVLGPLEVAVKDQPLILGGRRQRAVLAVLLLNANEFVPIDRLVEETWIGRPPPSAAGTVQTYISRLRRALVDSRASVITRGDGYELRVDPSELDVTCFQSLCADARDALRSGDPGRALKVATAALQLWRGDVLADLVGDGFAAEAVRRLDELRLSAEIDRIEAELQLGRADAALVSEIERLVSRRPHDERLRERLMLALYRSGRQAEALTAFHDARAILVSDFGIEPSVRLRSLQRSILQHDPALEAPHRGHIRVEEPGSTTRAANANTATGTLPGACTGAGASALARGFGDFGWSVWFTNEPDGSRSYVLTDVRTGEVIRHGCREHWDDVLLAVISNLYPPSREGLRRSGRDEEPDAARRDPCLS
jgi:DNA-binding SARP family transcriptional activator